MPARGGAPGGLKGSSLGGEGRARGGAPGGLRGSSAALEGKGVRWGRRREDGGAWALATQDGERRRTAIVPLMSSRSMSSSSTPCDHSPGFFESPGFFKPPPADAATTDKPPPSLSPARPLAADAAATETLPELSCSGHGGSPAQPLSQPSIAELTAPASSVSIQCVLETRLCMLPSARESAGTHTQTSLGQPLTKPALGSRACRRLLAARVLSHACGAPSGVASRGCERQGYDYERQG